MKGKIFRIAHLGYFDFADLFAVVAGLEIILRPMVCQWSTERASPPCRSLRRARPSKPQSVTA